MAILERLIREHVDFDPKLIEHRRAYLMLQYQGRQHPTLRFVLKVPNNSVLHMMQAEMARHLCESEIVDMEIDTTYRPDVEADAVAISDEVNESIRAFMANEPAVFHNRRGQHNSPRVSGAGEQVSNLATLATA